MTSGDRLVTLSDNIGEVVPANIVEVLGSGISSIDELKANPTDLSVVYSKIDSVQADTTSISSKVNTLNNYDDTSLVNSITNLRTVVDNTEVLVTSIEQSMVALEPNEVESLYQKIADINTEIANLLTVTNAVPQSTYDITFGKVV